MTSSTKSLSDALAALAEAAATAGIDADTARAEGEALAATVAEAAKGAFVDWSAQTGRPASADAFMDAASRGRRYRVAPTPTMGQLQLTRSAHAPSYAQALADVAFAATSLGEENPRTVGNAAGAAAAQLGESGGGPAPVIERQPVPDVGDEITRSLLSQLGTIQQKLAGSLDLSGLQTPEVPTQTTPDPVQAAPAEPAPPAEEPEPEPEEDPKTVEELLAELDELVGLADVKAEIHRQAAVLRVEGLRQQAGLKAPTITRHMIFNGNPGTGKTTVARLVAGIYRALGLLSKGQLVEVDRSELVAGYLGQTAMKTAEVVKSAEGGVLFIDEAYSLAGDQYGQEAVDTLVKEMEDKRDDLVVIVAGYPQPMEVFVAQNPGLASRFRTTIDFADYTDDELADIFGVMTRSAEYDVDDAVLARLAEILALVQRGPTFGNARYVRNLLEAAIGRHAWRLREIEQPTLEQLRTLVADDLEVEPLDPPVQPTDAGVVDPFDGGEETGSPEQEETA
ncbi:AAA family ATPase [Nocardioides lianchengensis]|uniref:ATPase family associated with various cellular activities (AAA) n=1 Tax=Nocardioides lianchengensis TaxID=1045774 RepID=A0A1G6NNL3_9ACTN|nr:AAA family ATPase [Nocardioides lianchengensis]NYG10822.1 Holliday junction resolvasome RuvABC ATP-dependent DNA helicase subunit [Nocardioides lianchengensis]SDC68964.1 ATPase family associated with various cellular activities (AAA) [Nocardioides lianchengensis]